MHKHVYVIKDVFTWVALLWSNAYWTIKFQHFYLHLVRNSSNSYFLSLVSWFLWLETTSLCYFGPHCHQLSYSMKAWEGESSKLSSLNRMIVMSLTQCFNHCFLSRKHEMPWRGLHNQMFPVIYIDLQHFQVLHDTVFIQESWTASLLLPELYYPRKSDVWQSRFNQIVHHSLAGLLHLVCLLWQGFWCSRHCLSWNMHVIVQVEALKTCQALDIPLV